ncbi:MAG: phosphate starvation-inducible protein PhoH [Candidatus Pelagibacter sp.]|nr:phosphate starvation-inducible protein PhoH [Candidatus Pelagibacter sp.]OUV87177.1 MAG: phosphate starvation-inducible protein PhoH [Pelagibacteraceae bacterium TMED136]|tara:strand:- start:3886 stop:4269 length:384 start_codon:yes stop_codon:yes gene_type:complete
MKNLIRITQLVGAGIVLVATIIAFFLEILNMFSVQSIQLADLLLLFIYLEVMGMVGNYWSNQSIRLTYPLFIAITALARLIILQKKDIGASALIYESGAILLLAIAIVVLKLRKSKMLKINLTKGDI